MDSAKVPRARSAIAAALVMFGGVANARAQWTDREPPGVAAVLSVNRSALYFVAHGGAISPPQSVSVTVSDAPSGGQSWNVSASQPWIALSRSSGTGNGSFTIGIVYDYYRTTAQGTVTVSGLGVSPVTIAVTLTVSFAAAAPAFGSFDTPTGDATVLAGSIAVTGWTLDKIGVNRVELWRDLQPGETTTPFSSPLPGDPRTGKVFIANATFVEGARPDVEAQFPDTPASYRAGWGYLLLTWGLWNQGNGTYKLYAFAYNVEGLLATIGSKTIVVSNNTATRPFGSIDTPAIGGDASGPNFGWALTPMVNGVATCTIPPTGVQFSIDSGPLQPVVYGDARSDVAAAFPGFSNSVAAGGHATIDWPALPPGAHTIGWFVTDDCGRTDGIGSRFFNVVSSSSQAGLREAALTAGGEASLSAGEAESTQPILVSRGVGELPERIAATDSEPRRIEMTQTERIEIRVPRGFDSAYQVGPNGRARSLPTGTTWDRAAGMLYWQPAPGFLGRYRIVFRSGTERITVDVFIGKQLPVRQ